MVRLGLRSWLLMIVVQATESIQVGRIELVCFRLLTVWILVSVCRLTISIAGRVSCSIRATAVRIASSIAGVLSVRWLIVSVVIGGGLLLILAPSRVGRLGGAAIASIRTILIVRLAAVTSGASACKVGR